MPLPSQGQSRDDILASLRAYKQHDAPWRAARVLAGVFDPGPEIEATVKAAYMEFLSENALYVNYYPSLLQIENDVVRTMADLLQGDAEVVGNITSGGTESILMAVKAARDKARAEHPEITVPEMVLPLTAHVAFHKAAHYLGLTPVVVPFNPETFRVEPDAIRAAITPNTILVVASAPCYSHGVVDPIPEIAAIAQERDIPMHVDACVGGIYLSMMRRMGEPVPPFDLSVPGVTSLSVDLHKFGYAPKNASVILYRNRALRRYALYASADTTAYAVINTTAASSRSGGPLAAAWAALHALGEEGYREIVGATLASTHTLMDGVRAIPELRILGEPAMCLFAFASDTLNVFELDDAMTRRGWFLQPQFSAGGSPSNLHVVVNRSFVGHEDELLAALREAVAEVRDQSSVGDVAALREEVLRLMATPGPETFGQVAALAGLMPGQMPDGFARINTVLDVMPRPLVDALLVEYINSLYA